MRLNDDRLPTKSDKGPLFHDYLRTYESFFTEFRCHPIALIEIGVLGGDSLKIWDDYFTNEETRIVGIDVVSWPCEHTFTKRVKILNGDGGHEPFLRSLAHPFDICIDDGPHLSSQQIRTFSTLFPLLAPGGLYCIEDLHSYAAPELCDAPENIMQFLTRIATEMQGKGAKASGKVEPTDMWASISTITFRKGLCVIKKAK